MYHQATCLKMIHARVRLKMEEVLLDYPQKSGVRDRLDLEKENARKAASKVANHFNKEKKKKGKSPKQINRRTPKHKDMVS